MGDPWQRFNVGCKTGVRLLSFQIIAKCSTSVSRSSAVGGGSVMAQQALV